jgi:hypothetical protein
LRTLVEDFINTDGKKKGWFPKWKH